MSATRTYEGPDIESVLAVVREREGARARILNAEKRRRGGLGGFFAKEVYVVTVADDEVDENGYRNLLDDPAVDAPIVRVEDDHRSLMDSLLALADDTSEREQSRAASPRTNIGTNWRPRNFDDVLENARRIAAQVERDLDITDATRAREAALGQPSRPFTPIEVAGLPDEQLALPVAETPVEVALMEPAPAPAPAPSSAPQPEPAVAPAAKAKAKKSIGPKPKAKVKAPVTAPAMSPAEAVAEALAEAGLADVVVDLGEASNTAAVETAIVTAVEMAADPAPVPAPEPVTENVMAEISPAKKLTPATPKSRRGYKIRRGRKGEAIEVGDTPMLDDDDVESLISAVAEEPAVVEQAVAVVDAPEVVDVSEALPADEAAEARQAAEAAEALEVAVVTAPTSPAISASAQAIVEALLQNPEITLASIRWSDDEVATIEVPQSAPVVETAALPEVPAEFKQRLDAIDARARLPHAPLPRLDRGGVIAVLGSVDTALAVARGHSRDVLVASRQSPGPGVARWLWVPDSVDARSRARRWSGLDKAVVIVVESSLTLDDDGWTAAMLDALGPLHIRLAADAQMSPDEIDAWMGALAASMIPVASVDFLDAV